MKKRIAALFLSVVMLCGMFTETVHAENVDEPINLQEQTEESEETEESVQTEENEETEESVQTEESEETEESVQIEETEESTESEEVEKKSLEDEVKTRDMYRLYNPNSGEHFYTNDANERDYLASVGWNYEGISWKAPATGDPVYRLYNQNAGDHHYTLNANERDYLVSVGWNYEGICWYSTAEKSVPIFRVYNPNAVTGTHHYTADYNEIQYLVSVGWNYEGIGWYSNEGVQTSIGSSGTTEVKERIEIDASQSEDGYFEVSVYLNRDINQVKKVYIPVWTKEDQSDIKWYEAKKQANGSFVSKIDVANHNWFSGTYNVHCYILTPQGDTRYIAETEVAIKPGTRARVKTLDKSAVRVSIYGVPDNVTKVRFPAWSVENDQDDLVWYEGNKNADGSWSVDIHSWNHKSIGEYICDIYVTVKGVETFSDRAEFTISEKTTNKWIRLDGYKRYIDAEGNLATDVSNLVTGPYYIKVYKSANYVIVYAKSETGNYDIPVKAMLASCGNSTPTGTFTPKLKWEWLRMVDYSWGQYCTQITGDFLFHSVPYAKKAVDSLFVEKYNALGQTKSLGCVRLQVENAKWLFDNWSSVYRIQITTSESGGPIEKPVIEHIPEGHTWDPTDLRTRDLCQKNGCH